MILKRIGIILAGLAAVLVIAVLASYGIGSLRLANAGYEINSTLISVEGADLDRGQHLVENVAVCISCHASDLGGDLLIKDAMIGVLYAPNLTSGNGGIGSYYTLEDWNKAVRHGVGADGRVLGGMPSNHYAHLSDSDLAAIIAYIQAQPAVDRELPERSLSFPGSIIFGLVGFSGLPGELIDHAVVGSASPPEGVSVDYGRYLVTIGVCSDCHGPEYHGRTAEEAQMGPPAGPDLTMTGRLGSWTLDDFRTAMRSGRTPDGRLLNDEMPWQYYGGMSDDELAAMFLYLQQLPGR